VAQRQISTHPNIEQLKKQAKDLLCALHASEPEAVAELATFHPRGIDTHKAKLADAQLALARSYGFASWVRLILACQMVIALRSDDAKAAKELVLKHPQLLEEDVLGDSGSNWGPPMSYAANLGSDRCIAALRELGAKDIQKAFDRACLQGRVDTSRRLLEYGAKLERGVVIGPCETHNPDGLKFLLDIGAELCDEHGNEREPVAMLLQTYDRGPGKHECLELLAERGIELPDTPAMAIHRGRIDLLEGQLHKDPDLPHRRFSYVDVYPPEVGCHEPHKEHGLHGTPFEGATLLHIAIDFNEMAIAEWLLEKGADPNARAAIDSDGFGGHTPLFSATGSQAHCAGVRRDDAFARLLLDHGADVNARATLRKRLLFVEDESLHEFRDVTPLAYGQRFQDQRWINRQVMELLKARGAVA